MNWILPDDVLYILKTLNQNGFEAYAVGGCVRDLFLNKTPQDWDITTSAPPEEIIRSFDKTVPTGMQHGTVTVLSIVTVNPDTSAEEYECESVFYANGESAFGYNLISCNVNW